MVAEDLLIVGLRKKIINKIKQILTPNCECDHQELVFDDFDEVTYCRNCKVIVFHDYLYDEF